MTVIAHGQRIVPQRPVGILRALKRTQQHPANAVRGGQRLRFLEQLLKHARMRGVAQMDANIQIGQIQMGISI